MKTIFKILFTALLAISLSCNSSRGDNSLRINETNNRYFSYKGRPVILMGSTEHYGAVMNLDFNYEEYLNELQRCGLNLTRTFSGIYVEPEGAFNIEKNTLAPAYNRYINPFTRSSTPGYANGGNKFDLSNWDSSYFKRLKDFMKQASSRDIIVEITLFSSIYEEAQWKLNPLHPDNNINNLPSIGFKEVHSLNNPLHLDVQERMVRKIVTELNEFDNLYYEVCNEPYADQIPEEWHNHIADIIAETEANLPKKHMISYNYGNSDGIKKQLYDRYSILNFHYARPDAVLNNHHLNIPIGDNETGFNGTSDWPYRTEAWAFMLAGGALFNHLDYSFAVGHESGNFQYPLSQPGGGNAGLRMQFGFLRKFLEQIDFLHMVADTSFIKCISNSNLAVQAATIDNKMHLVYLYKNKKDPNENVSIRFTGDFYVPETGRYTFNTLSDDGIRLRVNNALIIENWTDHAAQSDTGFIKLTAGEVVPVVVDYYNGLYGGSIKVKWNNESSGETILGTVASFYPKTKTKGLKAEFYKGRSFNDLLRTDTVEYINHTIQEFSFANKNSPKSAIEITINPTKGEYRVEWINPENGKVLRAENIIHQGGSLQIQSIPFEYDLLLIFRNMQRR